MDCTFDHLIEDYTQIVLDYDSLISYYEKMTEHELIEHINEMECSETADEIISTHYGLNPPDCYITGRDDQKIQPETSSQTVYSRIPSRY